MNILFFSYNGFNPKEGGVERVSGILAEEFIKQGHNVFFITENSGYKDENYHPLVEETILSDPENRLSKEEYANAFTNYCKENKIDIILCHNPHLTESDVFYFVKERTGVKLLYVFHSSPRLESLEISDTSKPILRSERCNLLKEYHRFFRILFKKYKIKKKDRKAGQYFNILNATGDGIVLLSREYINAVMAVSDINTPEKLFAINNPNTYNPSEIKKAEKENTILFVGRLSAEKSPEKVVFLWKKLVKYFPDWNMKIVGDGPLKVEIEELAAEWKLDRLSFEGRKDPAPYYAKARIIVFASDYEGFPMALTEAMQHGAIPIVFDSFGAAREIIDDGETGILVRPYDIDEFEHKLALLMSDSEQKFMEMSEKARVSVQRFDRQNIVAQWLDLLNKIIK